MPKEAINLELLIAKIENGEIMSDSPLLTYRMTGQKDFYIFQDSGLNILLGKEGNGKTKFLTQVMIELLRKMNGEMTDIEKIIYIDTERPESQYAFTIKHILQNCCVVRDDFLLKFNFFSVSELLPVDIKKILRAMVNEDAISKSVIILDHILPLVSDFNSVSESSEIDHLLKALIKRGNIIIASIHMPYNGFNKGLGHLGSSLGRQASFILEIANSDQGSGFMVTQRKSRISSRNEVKLFLKMDSDGNITNEGLEIIEEVEKAGDSDDTAIVGEILKEFVTSNLTEKKQLLSIIQKRKKWNNKSSSIYSFYNTHFKELIAFGRNDYQITEQGKEILNVEE